MLWVGQILSLSGMVKKLKEILDDVEYPIIVEGKRDVDAINEYGVEEVVSLKGRPLFKVALSVSKNADKALVLVDFDEEGEKIAKKLNTFLERFGVVPKNSIRGKIKHILTLEGISQIENIPGPQE